MSETGSTIQVERGPGCFPIYKSPRWQRSDTASPLRHMHFLLSRNPLSIRQQRGVLGLALRLGPLPGNADLGHKPGTEELGKSAPWTRLASCGIALQNSHKNCRLSKRYPCRWPSASGTACRFPSACWRLNQHEDLSWSYLCLSEQPDAWASDCVRVLYTYLTGRT